MGAARYVVGISARRLAQGPPRRFGLHLAQGIAIETIELRRFNALEQQIHCRAGLAVGGQPQRTIFARGIKGAESVRPIGNLARERG